MEFEEVVQMVKDSNEKVDELLKAAKLQRHERKPMSREVLEMLLGYILGGLAMTFAFVVFMTFMYYMSR